jgi:hypothetical protein
MESSVIEHMEMDEDDSLAFCEGDGAFHSAFEDDFESSCYARYGRRGSDDRGSKFS